jgi:hypothetical protein
MRVNGGADSQASAMAGDVAGMTGTATASSATSLTATGTPFVASAYIGHIVVTTSAAMAYGVITANTTSVLTVDQWYAPGSPGGAATTTPTATTTYTVLPGNAPSWYMALTTNSSAASATDTTLASEITTAGGGLIRKLATYAHTTGAASYSLAATFTVNGSDTGLPVTIAKIGIFNSVVGATGRMQFETLLGTSAVLSAIGDAVTITDTVSL